MYKLTLDDIFLLLMYNDDFLILTHKKPDGDTLGSAVALCIALREKGKKAYIHNSEEIGQLYIDMCKPYFPDEDFEAKSVVSVDTATLNLLPKNAEHFGTDILLSIDHHPSNTEFAGHNYIDSNAAATGEIIYEIIRKMELKPTKELMAPIYVAVSTDTGCFCYSNTTVNSHMIGAKAIECGVDISTLNKLLFETKTLGRIALEGEIYKTIEYYFENQVAVSKITRDFINKNGITEDDLDNISSLLRKIKGVECGLTVIEQSNGDLKISARSGEKVDVSMACQKIGGGGHKRASGATIEKGQEEKMQILLSAIEVELHG